jgi:hypothetical protein
MIYLKPVGGLCNRMRAIESTVALCEENNCSLTVFWIKNKDLNCSFKLLFKDIKSKKINIEVVEFSNNLVEYYANKVIFYKNKRFGFYKYLKYHLKNYIKNNSLEFKIVLILWKIKEPNFILNKEFIEIYNSNEIQTDNVNEMDLNFIKKIKPLIKNIFSNKKENSFIESCFRINPVKNNLQIFNPTENLEKQINAVTSQFKNTIGLHIRRTDHFISIEKSKTSNFISIIDEVLKENNKVTFFIASDDHATKMQLLSKYSKNIITNEVMSYDRNKSSSIENALIDLYCLSKTDKVFGSYHSTFSQTAAIIGNIDNITVF